MDFSRIEMNIYEKTTPGEEHTYEQFETAHGNMKKDPELKIETANGNVENDTVLNLSLKKWLQLVLLPLLIVSLLSISLILIVAYFSLYETLENSVDQQNVNLKNLSEHLKTTITKMQQQIGSSSARETLENSVDQQNVNLKNLSEHLKTTITKMQQQIVSSSARVAMTACKTNAPTLPSGSVVKFDNIRKHIGISSVSSFQNSGKFTCENEGLYLVSAWIISNTDKSQFAMYYNGDSLASAYVMYDGASETNVGTATAIVSVELKVGDTVWVQTKTKMYIGPEGTCFTIAKLK